MKFFVSRSIFRIQLRYQILSCRTGHYPGTRGSEVGSATSKRRTGPTDRHLARCRPPPCARIDKCRTLTPSPSTTVRAAAASDRSQLCISRTGLCAQGPKGQLLLCCYITGSQDSRRAVQLTFASALQSEI